jgi:hypothetical protein
VRLALSHPEKSPEASSGLLRLESRINAGDVGSVRVLLQHARTQLYLRSLGNWTPDPLEGYDFRHSGRAIEFARQHAVTGVEIAVWSDDREEEETFAIVGV